MISAHAKMNYSQHDVPRPTIQVTSCTGTQRHLRAHLHILAAVAEELTPAGRGWCVVLEPHMDRLYLELEHGTEREGQEGLELLGLVLDRARATVKSLVG